MLNGSYKFISSNFTFDSSLGFPGKGLGNDWINGSSDLILVVWNYRSLTFERFKYVFFFKYANCESLQYDVLTLTDLWRSYEKFCDGTLKWIYGNAESVNGQPRFPEDHTACVGLFLSERTKRKYISHGTPCERIVWSRLKDPVTNVFVMC